MRVFTMPLPVLFFLLCQYNCLYASIDESALVTNKDTQAINQVVSEAVEYHGWVNEPDYREKLSQMYDGDLLAKIINSVEQFRSESTDWHTLTFVRKCHIVYNDRNTATVKALLEETNPEGAAVHGTGIFTLHKTKPGWRITRMEITWH